MFELLFFLQLEAESPYNDPFPLSSFISFFPLTITVSNPPTSFLEKQRKRLWAPMITDPLMEESVFKHHHFLV